MSAILINGINYSWGDISLVLFGVPVTGITEIKYNTKQKKENNYGIGVDPVSRGYGNKEPEASITMYTDMWMQIIAAAPNNDPLDIPPFDIPVVFGNSLADLATDTLKSVDFLENPMSGSQGDTRLMVTIPLLPAKILRTGNPNI